LDCSGGLIMKTITVLIDTLEHDKALRQVGDVIEMDDAQADALIAMEAAIEAIPDPESESEDEAQSDKAKRTKKK